MLTTGIQNLPEPLGQAIRPACPGLSALYSGCSPRHAFLKMNRSKSKT